ncbi:MAG: hypothetical protein ABIC82_03770 [bacterium]
MGNKNEILKSTEQNPERKNYLNAAEYVKENKRIVVPSSGVDNYIEERKGNMIGGEASKEVTDFKKNNIGRGEIKWGTLTFLDSEGNVCEIDLGDVDYEAIQSIPQDKDHTDQEKNFIAELHGKFKSLYHSVYYPDDNIFFARGDAGEIEQLKGTYKNKSGEEKKEEEFDL